MLGSTCRHLQSSFLLDKEIGLETRAGHHGLQYSEGVPETVIATRGQQICLPSVVLGELHFGFMKGKHRLFQRTCRKASNHLFLQNHGNGHKRNQRYDHHRTHLAP